MNCYIKVAGHSNWFLVLSKESEIDNSLEEIMQEKILRSHVKTIHNKNTEFQNLDFQARLTFHALNSIDYSEKVNKYGTILVRPIGSWMPLRGNEENIVDEKFDLDFPIDEFGDIVICENDKKAENEWVEFLKKEYPNKSIKTISFFDLQSDHAIQQFFNKAELITFSTTFSSFEWFEKLTRLNELNKRVIGYTHDPEKINEAITINKYVKFIDKL